MGLDFTLVGIRFIHWTASLLLLGNLLFQSLVLRGAFQETSQIRFRDRMSWLNFLCLGITILSGLLLFWLTAAEMSGDDRWSILSSQSSDLDVVWNQTQFGAVSHWRTLFAALLVIHLIVASRLKDPGRFSFLAIGFAGGIVGSLAWQGHGQVGTSGWHLIADLLHLLAASWWPSALLPMLLTVRYLQNNPDILTKARVIQRFSNLSLIAVGIILLTGLVNSFYLLHSIGSLVTTSYGTILLIKMVLFSLMVGCGAINVIWIKPVLLKAVSRDKATLAMKWLGWLVLGELFLAMGVLLAVSVLGMSEPG